jgi:hypothetical protein
MVSADTELLAGVIVLDRGGDVMPIERDMDGCHEGFACGACATGARGVGMDGMGCRRWGGRCGRCDAWCLNKESGRRHT